MCSESKQDKAEKMQHEQRKLRENKKYSIYRKAARKNVI